MNDAQPERCPHIKGKAFPTSFILDAINLYNQGYTAPAASRLLKERHGLTASDSSIESWIAEYRYLCTYARFRDTVRAKYSQHQLVRTVKLYHRQIYEIQLAPRQARHPP